MKTVDVIKQFGHLSKIAPKFGGYHYPGHKVKLDFGRKEIFIPGQRVGDGRFFLATAVHGRKINGKITLSNGAY